MSEAAARPAPGHAQGLEALVQAGTAEVRACREAIQKAARSRGDLTEYMLGLARLAVWEKALNAAAMVGPVEAQAAPAPVSSAPRPGRGRASRTLHAV